MADVVKDAGSLRKRLRRLLFQNKRADRPELHREILPMLEQVGHLALIGGAIRDVALRGGDTFRSDLDFVLFDGDNAAFKQLMNVLGAKANRFGGYGLRFARWKIDIWALEDTWARTEGLRRVETIADLVGCTFFNWDAAVYNLRDGTLHTSSDYLSSLRTGFLEINLRSNPNPKGSLVRALRRGRRWNAYFGPELTEFVLSELAKHSWEDLMDVERHAFGNSYIQTFDRNQLAAGLRRPCPLGGRFATKPFGPDPAQLELCLD